MSALAIKQGTALRFDARERTEITRERTPFQKQLQNDIAEQREAPKAAPRKIPTKSAKKVEAPVPAPAQPTSPSPTNAEPTLAAGTGPVEVVTAAALTSTVATPAVTAVPANANANATTTAVANVTPLMAEAAAIPLSPLEQALQDLVDRIQPMESESDETEEPAPLPAAPELVPTPTPITADTDRPAVRETHPTPAPSPVTDLEKLAELAATQAENASHVNLVIDDGDARIVLAVAVHGQDVRVAMRASDDHIAASLARNAASLDHALHTRGLDLAELANESRQSRDPHEGRSSQRQPRERDEAPAKQFRIEEYL